MEGATFARNRQPFPEFCCRPVKVERNCSASWPVSTNSRPTVPSLFANRPEKAIRPRAHDLLSSFLPLTPLFSITNTWCTIEFRISRATGPRLFPSFPIVPAFITPLQLPRLKIYDSHVEHCASIGFGDVPFLPRNIFHGFTTIFTQS